MKDLFEADEVVSAGRIRLSLLRGGELDAMGWVEAALAPDWQLDSLADAAHDGRGVLVSDAEGAAIGVAAVEPGPVEDSWSVPFLTIEPSRRFRGLGGEAGLALERHLRERIGIEKVFVPVPDGRGLAVYFWLRLGFRPLVREEWPGPVVGLRSKLEGGIWMLRGR